MVPLQLREKEIFNTLRKIRNEEFVVIGGYAVNAYTLPRFSVDCDIVVKGINELKRIAKKLLVLGYAKEQLSKEEIDYYGRFERYKKEVAKCFDVSIDILSKEITDRQTKAAFSEDWIFENSELRILKGKTIQERLKLRIINPDALFVMKMISSRASDIRDCFMLAPCIKEKEWVKHEVSKRYDFNDRFAKLKNKITSKQFKDGLQGVFGFVDEQVFNKHKEIIFRLGTNSAQLE